MWCSLKIASDHAQILRPGSVRDQDGQRRSFSFRVRPTHGAAAGLFEGLKHMPSLALRGAGIADAARLKIMYARIQRLGHCPRYLPADLLVHVSRHSRHLVSARYHVQRLS
jgi:hypothetical protein